LSGGTATPRAVPTWPQFIATAMEVVTAGDGVHRHVQGDALPGVVWCHRRFLPEVGKFGPKRRGSPPW
jgi:hypothetical protein